MSYTFLQEQGEASSAESFTAMYASAPSSWKTTLDRPCCNDNATASCPGSRSGMTSPPLMADHGGARSISSPGAFPARISLPPAGVQESPAADQDFGERWRGSFARWDRATSLWKTRQSSLLGGLTSFSATWPRWGWMRHGECFQRQTPERLTVGNGSGLFPEAGGGYPRQRQRCQ